MIRNLKILMLAALAVTAFGVFNASGAQAASEFHCSVGPCRYTLKPDGTGATAHHVFVVKNSIGETVSFTCKKLDGEATTIDKTATELTVTGLGGTNGIKELEYTECNGNGEPVTIDMNGCDYKLAALNGGTTGGASVKIECPTAKHIQITLLSGKCIFEVTPQTVTGIHYHNIGEEAKTTTEVTVEAKVPGIAVEVSGSAPSRATCLIDPTQSPITGEYTTGNTIVTGETDVSTGTGTMANAWWTA